MDDQKVQQVKNSKPKILVLASRFPYPLEKGDKLRLYHQIKTLSRYADIFLFAIGERGTSKQDFEQVACFTKEIHFFRLDAFSRLFSLIRGAFSILPFQVLYFYHKKIEARIKILTEKIQPDHVYCQLARMAPYAIVLPYPRTLDYMDAFGVGMARRATVVKWPVTWVYQREARLMKKYESNLLSMFNRHVVISKQDGQHIGESDKNQIIHVVPNGIDDSFLEAIQVDKKFDLVFVGNMGYLPNIEAAEFLVKQLLPGLPDEINLLIAGARPHPRVWRLQSDRVKVGGWYEDIKEAYLSAKIFVAPLWSGTGQQNKILEAMALGLPCVTTTVVNNAIHGTDGLNILLADNVNEFVYKINYLLSQPSATFNVGLNAKKFVKQNYNWEKSSNELMSIFFSR